MALTKVVNGETVELSPEEEAAILAGWAANTPTLDQYKANKISSLNALSISIVEKRYPSAIMAAFAALIASGKPNQSAYCQQLLTWGGSVVAAYASAAAQVQAAQDQEGVDAVSLDEAGLVASDPGVSLPVAMSITS